VITEPSGVYPVDSPLQRTVSNIDGTAHNLRSITDKMNQGTGTLGHLLNDSSIAEKIEQTLDDTSEFIGRLSRIEAQIELRSEYGVPFTRSNNELQASIKNTLALRLVTQPDKYYVFEAIADPRGKSTRTITTTADGNTVSKVETNQLAFNDLKFSAQFAKRYYWITLRFGIIENTGGLGINLHTLDDQLEVRFDAFDFSRRDPDKGEIILPRLRVSALYEFYKHLSLQVGIDDPLNHNLRTWFVGGVLRFTDKDLTSLLTVAPSSF
jgi:phospholipid/cholesterol/gamma-HCH transport system substrate-binding protein